MLSAAFEVPAQPTVVVPRPRLEVLLDAGTLGPLTLVSAPAGTGKTVLVSSWAAGSGAGRRSSGSRSGTPPSVPERSGISS